MTYYTDLNIFVFLYYLIIEWSIDKTIERLSVKYNCQNFLITFLGWRIWFLQTSTQIKKILSIESNHKTTYIDKNIIKCHGHIYSINNLDFDCDKNNLWYIVHHCMIKNMDLNILEKLLYQNSDIITHKYGFKYNIVDVIDEFVSVIWSKYCFGNNIDTIIYKKLHRSIIKIMIKISDNSSNYIPIIGGLICKLNKNIYKEKINKINNVLQKLIDNKAGFIHNFYKSINQLTVNNNLKNLINNIVLDNAFYCILMHDYISVYLQTYLLHIATNNLQTTSERCNARNQCMEILFRSMYKILYVGKENDEFKKGDIAFINLAKSKLYFSYGPRACIGINLMRKLTEWFCKIFNKYTINRIDDNQIMKITFLNIPTIVSKHSIELIIPSNKALDLIHHFPYKGEEKFYRFESITENLLLYKYLCYKIADIVNITKKNIQIDYLVTSEARGFLFSSVSFLTNIPMISIRKAGKIPGECYSETYNKALGNKEILEMSIYSPVEHKNVIIIDDGIASGGTIQAIYNLICNAKGHVILAIVGIKHQSILNQFTNCDVKCIFKINEKIIY